MISPRVAERLLFFPSRNDPGSAPRLAGVEGADVDLTAPDGTPLHGWWHEVAPGAPAVVFLHGNAGNIAGRASLAEGYLARGISVFMLDYRGYGRSGGRPDEVGVHADAKAAVRWVAEAVGGAERTVIHGRSLGGVIGAGVARETGTAGLILESTFTSFDEMARAAYPFLPSFVVRRLRGHFDARSAVSLLQVPVLVVHGTADRLVPIAMGRELLAAAAGPTEWYEVPDADHNDVFLVGGEPYFDRLARFVHTIIGESR